MKMAFAPTARKLKVNTTTMGVTTMMIGEAHGQFC